MLRCIHGGFKHDFIVCLFKDLKASRGREAPRAARHKRCAEKKKRAADNIINQTPRVRSFRPNGRLRV